MVNPSQCESHISNAPKALWGSWAVFGPDDEDRGGSFWFGGDTAYCDTFKQIGKKLGPFDLAAIPIGE